MTVICQKLSDARWCAWIQGRAGSVVIGHNPDVAKKRLSIFRRDLAAGWMVKDDTRSRDDRHVFQVSRSPLTQVGLDVA